MPNMHKADRLKQVAAHYAVDKYVSSHTTIGLGTGSTMYFAVHAIANLLQQRKLTQIQCVSTSKQTTELAQSLHIPIADTALVLEKAQLDLAIDGADAINRHRQLIKGGGGALTQEKIIAYNSKRVVIIADERKLVSRFDQNSFPLPIEVVQSAHSAVKRQLLTMRIKRRALFQSVTLRSDAHNGKPFVTDNANLILDAQFNQTIRSAASLERILNNVSGVVANGLFCFCNPKIVVAQDAAGVREY